MKDDIDEYLSGKRLYGDDFSEDQIRAWFADEAEAYVNLGARDKASYTYSYHALNIHHAFSRLGKRQFKKVLGIGSAYGEEFHPLIERIEEIHIIDSSEAFNGIAQLEGVPCRRYKADPLGAMPFDDDVFDLICALGVLHHIPNVSHVVRESFRCLKTGGIMVLREPIVSMGDWRRPRPGLTARERGIPLRIMRQIIENAGFLTVRQSLCDFPPLLKVASALGFSVYMSPTFTRLDAVLSRLLSWNISYHRTSFWQKFAPASAWFVLKKPEKCLS